MSQAATRASDFGLAAVGMAAGLVQYTLGRRSQAGEQHADQLRMTAKYARAARPLAQATMVASRVLLFFTISELLLSPVGLSLATKLAPVRFHTQMVALFFLSVALGTAMSGLLTGYYSEQNEVPYFLWLGIAAIVVGAVLLAIAKPVKALMGGVH